ncbi:MAG: hypothetical protein HUU38_00075 [Anaerolineales bacterium]|nr:hypothetical protein [Anaerolineales bacterium]
MTKAFKRLLLLLFLPLLGGCGPTPQHFAATATWQVYDAQVATVIAGTETVRNQQATATAPTPTPPGPLPLAETLLSWSDLENLLAWDRMILDRSFEQDNFYQQFNLCAYECNGRAWENDETSSLLLILMGRYANSEEATHILTQNTKTLKTSSPADYPIFAALAFPENTHLILTEESTILIAQQGPIIVLMKLALPHLEQPQQMDWLGIFADKQFKKLINAGY